MFIGLAPFFAIMDRTVTTENFWEHCEIILLGLAVLFFTAFSFDTSSLAMALVLAIIYTLPFLGFAYIYKNLGPRSGKFIIIILWLGIEYTLIKIQWPSQKIFLADAFQAVPTWLRWNTKTGYLGASLWVLVANWIFYAGTLHDGIKWFLIVMAIGIVVGPIGYSLMLESNPILRPDMIKLYQSSKVSTVGYSDQGELVARTCTWLAGLIVLFAVVKSRVTKR